MELEIIPLLEVNEACQWCEGQQCFCASLWYGDCLVNFYSKQPERLKSERLNALACDILKDISRRLEPGGRFVIESSRLWHKLGNCGTLDCFWEDYRPPLATFSASTVLIPVECEATP